MASRSLLFPAVCLALLLGAGCNRDHAGGLPPASKWTPPAPEPSEVTGHPVASGSPSPSPAAGSASSSDQQGLPPGHPPIAGGGAGGAGAADSPHAGGSAVDPSLSAPDPDRPIDPKKFLSGRIRTTPDTARAVHAGQVLFISARPIDPATGTVLGAPLAVERVEVGALPMSFRLDESNMMVAGTRFEGDALITAWVDSDGDARTHQPGDVHGQLKAHIPQGDLDLVLDTVQQ